MMQESLTFGCVCVSNSSTRRQKGLTDYCFKYIDRPFCRQTDYRNQVWERVFSWPNLARVIQTGHL